MAPIKLAITFTKNLTFPSLINQWLGKNENKSIAEYGAYKQIINDSV
jgi:hypothetical protein